MKFYFFFLYSVLALEPNRLPNGNLKKYISRKNRLNDLIELNKGQASIISKNWMANIMIRKKEILSIHQEISDLHILSKVDELECILQEDNQNNIYYAWSPKCIYNYKDVLFLITIEKKKKKQIIKQVLQSPFWTPEQIESIELKKTLDKLDYIHYNTLYEKDSRYKLAWFLWYLNE